MAEMVSDAGIASGDEVDATSLGGKIGFGQRGFGRTRLIEETHDVRRARMMIEQEVR